MVAAAARLLALQAVAAEEAAPLSLQAGGVAGVVLLPAAGAEAEAGGVPPCLAGAVVEEEAVGGHRPEVGGVGVGGAEAVPPAAGEEVCRLQKESVATIQAT